jgi:phenylacetate-coenzyme A ligase PaaK-like adenylate-forming protein
MASDATLDRWAAERMGLSLPLSRPAIDAWQLARINDTLGRARSDSPFYRSRPGWNGGRISSFADLRQLPFTCSDDIVRNDPALVTLSQSAISRVVTLPSSGTSGPPKRLFFTADEQEATIDFFQHGMGLFTRPGDRVAVAFASERPGSVGDDLAEALRRLGATPVPVPSTLPPAEFATLLWCEGATVVAGAPVRLLAAARASAADAGLPLSIRAVLASSERLPKSVARALTAAWGCEVFDHWGMTETGLGGAVECSAHEGCHLRETDLFVEIVDPESGAPVPDGVVGEVVITTLRERAMPLVRYRTGDLAWCTDDACACGSVLRRLGGFRERIGDAVAMPTGGHLTMAMLDEVLFAIDAVSDFTASIEVGDPARLTLCIASPAQRRTGGVIGAVRAALAAEPTIGEAIVSGRLQADVTFSDDEACAHGGKRRLRRRN